MEHRYAIAIQTVLSQPTPTESSYGFQVIKPSTNVEILAWTKWYSDARRIASLLASDYVNTSTNPALVLLIEKLEDKTFRVHNEYKTTPATVVETDFDPYDGVPADTGTI